MSGRLFTTAAFFLAAVVGSQAQGTLTVPPNVALLPILTVLDEAKVSGSLRLTGRCDLQFLPDLPLLRAPGDIRSAPLTAVREVFADDQAMRVTEDPGGMIRMNEIGVPVDLLDVRIGHISFEDYAHSAIFNPNDALYAILRAPEVAHFTKAHNIVDTPAMMGSAVRGNAGRWPAEWPHISGSLDNVTLAEALDHVLKTFPGIWLYEDCPQAVNRNRVVVFRFFYLRRDGSGPAFVQE
jgi:hypothetical protein